MPNTTNPNTTDPNTDPNISDPNTAADNDDAGDPSTGCFDDADGASVAQLRAEMQRLADGAVRGRRTHGLSLGVQSDDGATNVQVAAGDAATDDNYAIASITKMFTAALVLGLVDDGRLRLDDRVIDLLPELDLAGLHRHDGVDHTAELAVHHLLHQTSGLADYWNGGIEKQLTRGDDRAYSVQDTIDIARDNGAEFAPGDRGGRRSSYSDTNYQLLAAIVEEATGGSYADAVSARITEPLGLTETYLFGVGGHRPAPVVLRQGKQSLSIPLALASERGAGAVVSTLDDQLRFSRAWHRGELFEGGTRRATPHWNRVVFFALAYGHGVMRYKLPRWMSRRPVPEMVGHSGTTGSFLFHIPALRCHVAGTFNQFAEPARPFRLLPRIASEIAAVQQGR
ncbi:serine hydrolase domain-containing protein [Ilumatobacter coccineus]|uniref:Peptidase S12 family protein n=1 Tax=Ilumatobacter coccineus (strain NBRC 103263 / KCTC 29153 / YM16-304) TaxID=1313172 RepID=A0A6C7E201_ILUCY|nr:serine hydrolase domain-containing protein [Ilumatobacter coccineus]BAN00873.1 peptidase S12 family protein [Ilumatobacter coccineus YM16-304]